MSVSKVLGLLHFWLFNPFFPKLFFFLLALNKSFKANDNFMLKVKFFVQTFSHKHPKHISWKVVRLKTVHIYCENFHFIMFQCRECGDWQNWWDCVPCSVFSYDNTCSWLLFWLLQLQLSVSTSSWSDGFSLDTVGSYGCVRCPANNMDFLVTKNITCHLSNKSCSNFVWLVCVFVSQLLAFCEIGSDPINKVLLVVELWTVLHKIIGQKSLIKTVEKKP